MRFYDMYSGFLKFLKILDFIKVFPIILVFQKLDAVVEHD